MRTWTTIYNTNAPGSPDDTKRSVWDRPVIMADQAVVISAFTNTVNRARLLVASAPHIGDWLHAHPLLTCGLRLDNETVRVDVGLRLGTSLCDPHQCPCGKQVDARGTHGLSCKRSAGRSIRHHELSDIIYRALTRASTPSVLEPPGLSRTDGKRPDGLTLIPWQREKSIIWDVTITDTVTTHTFISSSNISEGWWRCSERRYQEEGQVRRSTRNVHVRPAGARNAWTH